MAMKNRAFGYIRVSGKGQVEGDGPERQQESIQKYAKGNRLELVDFITDPGVSGKTELEHREGLATLLDRVEAEGVKVVIVERADRLARDVVVNELIIRQFKAVGVKVISADGGQDLTEGDDSNPTAKLILQILGAVAEFDRCIIVGKLKAARDRKRSREGRCEGRKPYGHRPNEQAVVQTILDLRRAVKGQDRTPFADIADHLNTTGFTTRKGTAWNPGTVYRIVKAQAPQLAEALCCPVHVKEEMDPVAMSPGSSFDGPASRPEPPRTHWTATALHPGHPDPAGL